jgi:streptogramin lyase
MPNGLAVDSSANVYVTEMNNHRVQKFNSSGTFLAKWGGYGSGDGQVRTPWGIAVDNSGNVYVAEYSGERISKFTSNGTFVAKWGTTGTGDGQFNKPTGVAVDVSGNVYIAEYGNCRVQKFRPRTGAPPPSLFGWAFGPLSDQRNRRP